MFAEDSIIGKTYRCENLPLPLFAKEGGMEAKSEIENCVISHLFSSRCLWSQVCCD